MEIIRFADLATTAWKNGGGVTREIRKREQQGQPVWRLSIADVAGDGPFSIFAGLERTLTVIEGQGMQLVRPDGGALVANRLMPITFSGEDKIDGRLMNGPCRDFNVMWNPRMVSASVRVVDAVPAAIKPLGEQELCLLLCVSETAGLDGAAALHFADAAILAQDDAPVTLGHGKLILVTIGRASQA